MTTPAPLEPAPRILLVEDSWENVAYVTALLDEVDCVVDTATNGRQAMDLFEPGKYAVILMDCQMPVMDGYQATAALRQREADGSRRLPVVALTANAMEGDREQCIAAGMDDYLAKPYTRTQLEALLSRWLAPKLPAKMDIETTVETAVEAAMETEAISEIRKVPIQTAASENQLPPAIDMHVLEQYRELDPDGGLAVAYEIMQIFLDSSDPSIEQIATAFTTRDAILLRQAAHSLKSSCASVGGLVLSQMLNEMEAHAKEGHLSAAEPMLPAIKLEYARVQSEIRAMLAQGA